MTIKNGDMPAMPINLADGLSKREMIAMHMMAAMLSKSGHLLSEHAVARDATRAADALLAALDRTNDN